MLYFTLRWVAATALRWLYRDVRVDGREHVPQGGPLLIAANHPNQLIDVLLVATALERRVLFTGKAVLLDNPVVAALCRAVGFIPLRRASDERARRTMPLGNGKPGAVPPGAVPPGAVPLGAVPLGELLPGELPPDTVPRDPGRNADAFRAIIDALAANGAVLVFPEGISHNEPQLAPLKTGIARIALQANGDARVRGLRVLPVGLTFERKWEPRTRALVQIGPPLDVHGWLPRVGVDASASAAANAPLDAPSTVDALTREIDARLRDLTLNFDTTDAADQVLAVSGLVSEVLADDVRPLDAPDAPLTELAGVARRAALIEQRLDQLPPDERTRVEQFLVRLGHFRSALAEARVLPGDVGLDTAIAPGIRFAVRETAVVLGLGPLAWWGRVNHWLPLRLARTVARRTSRTPQDPAMHTLVTGAVLVLAFYVLQTAVVWALAGPGWAVAYLVSLPIAARWDFRFHERMRRAAARVRGYLRFRGDPALQARLLGEARWLRSEAAAIDTALTAATDVLTPRSPISATELP